LLDDSKFAFDVVDQVTDDFIIAFDRIQSFHRISDHSNPVAFFGVGQNNWTRNRESDKKRWNILFSGHLMFQFFLSLIIFKNLKIQSSM
jgi:hypothetical protein